MKSTGNGGEERRLMLITLKSILPELQKSVPAFVMNPEWLQIEGTYLIFGGFARFICSEAEVLQYVSSEEEASRLSHVKISMAFLERALQDGDREVHDLALDCLESLASCVWIAQIKKYFGPEVSALWTRHFRADNSPAR
jgi:hypothetical protein